MLRKNNYTLRQREAELQRELATLQEGKDKGRIDQLRSELSLVQGQLYIHPKKITA